MDAATSKQKAFIKKLLVRSGVPRSEFNEPERWKIGKEDAHYLITELLLLENCHFGSLNDILSNSLEGKQVLRYVTKTIQELEEEDRAVYDPTSEDWLDQHPYGDNISQREWIRESQADLLREQEAVA